MDIYVKLAEESVRGFLEKNKLPKVKDQFQALLSTKAGCFVSIHTKDTNELRGCIGTVTPIHKNLAGEIMANALAAAFHDTRFMPVKLSELDNLKYSVDVLGEIEAIKSEKNLDPKKYGVVIRSKDMIRAGLLLPDLDGINDIKTQISIARDKAGIGAEEDILLYRFLSERHE